MAQPRFLLVVGRSFGDRLMPRWPGAGRAAPSGPSGPWVAWRLVGSNHRELARSSGVYADVAACEAEIAAVRKAVGDDCADMRIEAVGGLWGWSMSAAGRPLAVASRLYHRQRECECNCRLFLSAAAAATVASVPAMRGGDGAGDAAVVAR